MMHRGIPAVFVQKKKSTVERIHKKAKDCKTSSNKTYLWHYFRQLRNEYISDLRAAEENYFNRQFDSVNCSKKRGKGWWKTVNYFVKGGQTNNNYLLVDNVVVSDNKSKAEALNSFFLKSKSD